MGPLENPAVDVGPLARNVAAYQKVDVVAAGQAASVVNVVVNTALSKAPPTVRYCAAAGGLLGAFGGPVAWITVPMGMGSGAVVGCIATAFID